jgi:hypothetical protein
MDKANQAKELFNDFFSDIKSLKTEMNHKMHQSKRSPSKGRA